MRVRVLLIPVAGLLASCGGDDPGAALCIAEAASRLGNQVYRLDEAGLVASRKEEADGNLTYSGELLLKPGTGAEQKQRYNCKVAPATADSPARVVGVEFNVEGTGIYNK